MMLLSSINDSELTQFCPYVQLHVLQGRGKQYGQYHFGHTTFREAKLTTAGDKSAWLFFGLCVSPVVHVARPSVG